MGNSHNVSVIPSCCLKMRFYKLVGAGFVSKYIFPRGNDICASGFSSRVLTRILWFPAQSAAVTLSLIEQPTVLWFVNRVQLFVVDFVPRYFFPPTANFTVCRKFLCPHTENDTSM